VGQRVLNLFADILFALKKRCPVCKRGALFQPFSLVVVKECKSCGAKLGNHDVGDGAAVLLIFFLGFMLVPLSWANELIFAPPLWVHVIICGVLGLGLIALILPAIKAYVIMLEYRHRRER